MKFTIALLPFKLFTIATACYTASDCNNNGNCINGVCNCNLDWEGTTCSHANCVFGEIKNRKCLCNYGSDLINGICTKKCENGIFNNRTNTCECNENWDTAGITDTIDWLKGTCSQFKCKTDNQCSELLPEVKDATCPVKGWNCYCGFGNLGHENTKAGCMSFTYALSISAFKLYKYLCLKLIWKISLVLAIISIPFGRKRPNCDHHRSWLAAIKKCLGVGSRGDGSCAHIKRFCVRDDFALSLYWIKSGIWWYTFFSALILILGYIWSMVLWIIIGIVLLCFACMVCVGAVSTGNGPNNSNSDCCKSDCNCCSDCSCCSNSYSNNHNTYNII